MVTKWFETGTVVCYIKAQGYGFVQPDTNVGEGGSLDVHFSRWDLVSLCESFAGEICFSDPESSELNVPIPEIGDRVIYQSTYDRNHRRRHAFCLSHQDHLTRAENIIKARKTPTDSRRRVVGSNGSKSVVVWSGNLEDFMWLYRDTDNLPDFIRNPNMFEFQELRVEGWRNCAQCFRSDIMPMEHFELRISA